MTVTTYGVKTPPHPPQKKSDGWDETVTCWEGRDEILWEKDKSKEEGYNCSLQYLRLKM